jgi:hypothetical protein
MNPIGVTLFLRSSERQKAKFYFAAFAVKKAIRKIQKNQ